MITGGAIFPLLMGVVSDQFNLKTAYLIPIIAYLYIMYFGVKITKLTVPLERDINT
jgi:FHS family L-fucose permease-like MFS transporter